MKLETAIVTTGRKKVACRVNGSPHESASQPKTVVPIPPLRINLEAMATFHGMNACPMATVTELEDMMKSPAKANSIRFGFAF